MFTPNQVAEDNQLLGIARDYLQFTTNFFEVIDVSATHIYHSALEQSPLSSIIRKLYHHQQPHPSPRVVIGIPDSWDSSIASISIDSCQYRSSTWSPCGQFVAVRTHNALDIRDASTLKLLSTIQLTKLLSTIQSAVVATEFWRVHAYSPDGHSLACCSDIGIVIWDTQTGGVVKRITHNYAANVLELAWSLDGMTIGTISPWEGYHTVCTYDVASGARQSSSTFLSMDSGYLWAHDRSFRVMRTARDYQSPVVDIIEVGSTLTRVEQFPIQYYSSLGAFSPTTYRISVFFPGNCAPGTTFVILDIRSSEVLLQETGSYWQYTFSPDGTFFVATAAGHVSIWRYTSSCYTWWREFQQTPVTVQFSPTSPLILSYSYGLLDISYLDSPASLAVGSVIKTHGRPWDAFSPDSTYIAIAHQGESTIAITNLDSQDSSPSQFINANFEILGIALTGNVLLVKGPDAVVAWLLTEEGVIGRTFNNTRADCNNSLWMWMIAPRPIPLGQPPQLLYDGANVSNALVFSVEGEIAAIRLDEHPIRVYNTKTGEILKSHKAPQSYNHFNYLFPDQCERYHQDLLKHCGPLKYNWPVLETTLHDGWVKDSEGKHRLWLHVRWRSPDTIDRLHNGTTLRLTILSELVIIRF